MPSGLLLWQAAAPSSRSKKAGVSRAVAEMPVRKGSRNIFIDESGGATDEFRVAGCLTVDTVMTKKIKAIVRNNLGDEKELKWNRVSNRNYSAHRKVVEAIFDALDRKEIQFNYAVAQASSASWPDPLTDIGYSRAVDSLLRRCALEHRFSHKLYIYPQRRRAEGSSIELRRTLNRFASDDKFAKTPVRLIEYRDSKVSLLNQVVDVLVGALAYHANARPAHYAPNSEKWRLAHYIAGRVLPSNHVTV